MPPPSNPRAYFCIVKKKKNVRTSVPVATVLPDDPGHLFESHAHAHAHACLNCGHKVPGQYCGHCGQQLHIHRLSVRHFLAHDLIHGLFHVDRGVFYTLREVTLRPGYAALDYIRGKRTGKFPIVTLLLILSALLLYIQAHNPWNGTHTYAEMRSQYAKGLGNSSGRESFLGILDFVVHNIKWFLLALIPLNAFTTRIVFRRPRYNRAEHLLLNSYFFAGALVVAIVINLAYLLFHHPFELSGGLSGWAMAAFYVFAYWQAFGRHYRVAGFLWRTLAETALSLVFFIVLVLLASLVAGIWIALFRSGH